MKMIVCAKINEKQFRNASKTKQFQIGELINPHFWWVMYYYRDPPAIFFMHKNHQTPIILWVRVESIISWFWRFVFYCGSKLKKKISFRYETQNHISIYQLLVYQFGVWPPCISGSFHHAVSEQKKSPNKIQMALRVCFCEFAVSVFSISILNAKYTYNASHHAFNLLYFSATFLVILRMLLIY